MKLTPNIYDIIYSIINAGGRPVIKVNSILCDEYCPLSAGMLAHIVSVEKTDDDGNSYSLNLTLDASDFFESNKTLFTKDWKDDKNDTWVTALENGEYPQNHIIDICICVFKNPKEQEDSFDFVDDLIVENYKDSGYKGPIFNWLCEKYKETIK